MLLANLLDVNSGPSKNIHQLRVLSALLITVPKTEISIVSPCVHLCWVCNEKAETVGSIASSVAASKLNVKPLKEHL